MKKKKETKLKIAVEKNKILNTQKQEQKAENHT